LSGSELGEFVLRATTAATPEEFKCFLPRLLEIAAHDGAIGSTEFEVLWSTVANFKHHYLSRERNALETYGIALWRAVLSAFPSKPSAGACLCGIALFQDDLSTELTLWRDEPSDPSTRHLAECILESSRTLVRDGTLSNAFWAGRQQQMQQVVSWICSAEVSAKLEAAFYRSGEPAFQAAVSRAVEVLSWLTKG
jgi:hypothetical protein